MSRYEANFQGFIRFKHYKRSWAFPAEIERFLIDESVGLDRSTLHLYGGLASFGIRLDVNPQVRPHVIGNGLAPPFHCKSFDVVIVDPPYTSLPGGMAIQLMAPALCLARSRVYWFHTHWGPGSYHGAKLLRWWACSPCSPGSPMRILVEYQVTRHPRWCVVAARQSRKRLHEMTGRYDWTKLIPNPPGPGHQVMTQRRLL